MTHSEYSEGLKDGRMFEKQRITKLICAQLDQIPPGKSNRVELEILLQHLSRL